MITIHNATASDIPVVEAILADAAQWMIDTGKPMWNPENLRWDKISLHFCIEDFHIAYVDDIPGYEGVLIPVGCIAIIDHDPMFWDLPKGASLYIHKVAVKRAGAGRGVAPAMVQYAQRMAVQRGINAVRLDTHARRPKLCQLYEREGFKFVERAFLFGWYDVAFYAWEYGQI